MSLRCLEKADDREGVFPPEDLPVKGALQRHHIRPRLRIDTGSRTHAQNGERKASRLRPGALGTRGGDEQSRRYIVHERNQKPRSWLRMTPG
jgi:hypothetical protein